MNCRPTTLRHEKSATVCHGKMQPYAIVMQASARPVLTEYVAWRWHAQVSLASWVVLPSFCQQISVRRRLRLIPYPLTRRATSTGILT
jgi:hypothetical protein